MMFSSRRIATGLLPLVFSAAVLGQFSGRQQAIPFGDRPGRGDPDGQLHAQIRAYSESVAHGRNRAAAQDAFVAASIYERRQDYVNAETWYRACYANGVVDCSRNFIDLILLNKVIVNDTNAIRPFVEIRAVCGSHIAREFAFATWHETSAQIPIVQNQTLTTCGPVGPTDRMETNLAVAARRAQERQQAVEYYRQHPDETSDAKAKQAAAGAAILLGALVIAAASMPATGPGSVACNRYQNHFPGAYDASVCNVPPSK